MVKTRFFRALASNPKLVAVNALICALTIALAVDPKQCIASVHSALGMFVQSVLPALLPYFFFTKLLTSLGAARAIGDLFRRPVALLYNAPPIGGYVCLMSLLSGYPVGARLLCGMTADTVFARGKMRRYTEYKVFSRSKFKPCV